MKHAHLTATLLSAFALTLCITLPTHAAPRYTLSDLGEYVYPYDINNSGQWAGSANGYPVVFDGDRLASICFPDQPLARGAARCINNSGQVVGEIGHDAFLYSAGSLQTLSIPGARSTVAYGISDAGDVVGAIDFAQARASGGYSGTFLYAAGQTTDLADAIHPGSHWGRAINSKKQIVGGIITQWGVNTRQTAFLRDNDSLSMLDNAFAEAYDINDAGQFVGDFSITGARGRHAFLVSNGSLIDLGTLGDRPIATALHINNRAQIVGISKWADMYIPEYPPPDFGHAFLYSAGPMYDLNDRCVLPSNWVLREASALNDLGQIVGTADVGNRFSRRTHGFLLTAIPEPASLSLLLLPTLLLRRPR